jgi:hypothetical protein
VEVCCFNSIDYWAKSNFRTQPSMQCPREEIWWAARGHNSRLLIRRELKDTNGQAICILLSGPNIHCGTEWVGFCLYSSDWSCVHVHVVGFIICLHWIIWKVKNQYLPDNTFPEESFYAIHNNMGLQLTKSRESPSATRVHLWKAIQRRIPSSYTSGF